jgi:hypothetical protein
MRSFLLALAALGCTQSPSQYIVNSSIWGSPEGDLFIAGYDGDEGNIGNSGFVKQRSGDSWTTLRDDGPDLWGIWGTNSSNFYVLGGVVPEVERYRSGIWESWSIGELWPDRSDPTIRGIWGTAADDVLVVGRQGTTTHFDGAWHAWETPTRAELRAVWGSSATDVYAVGAGGTILHHDGTSWTLEDCPTTADLNDVWGSSATNVYAIGETLAEQSHVILHYDGTAWTVAHEGEAALLGIHGSGPDCVYAVGGKRNGSAIDGTVFLYDGTAWARQPVIAEQFLWDVWAMPDCSFYAVGPEDTVIHGAG